MFSLKIRKEEMFMKKIGLIVLVLIWSLVIFMFSNTNSTSSNNLSKSIGGTIISITNYLKITNVTDNNREDAITMINKPIRKLAHITEYFILSILVFNLLKKFKIRVAKYYLTFIICFSYSLLDEFHQTFINGRTGQFIDCIIDMIGVIIYLGIVVIATKRSKKSRYEEV